MIILYLLCPFCKVLEIVIQWGLPWEDQFQIVYQILIVFISNLLENCSRVSLGCVDGHSHFANLHSIGLLFVYFQTQIMKNVQTIQCDYFANLDISNGQNYFFLSFSYMWFDYPLNIVTST